ncbi:hypothetical protein ABZ915_41735 [Streptomyces sp. NPDC046915]|uniref:hypothetical protein n=1 Tax=Streptomyces sp. NPDC046915 TaxID=3155257 RepID=UPI0033F87674
MESAPVAGRSPLEVFARDLALCLSVNRDRGPALVWPDGVESLVAESSVADLAQAAAGAAPGTPPPAPPGLARAAELSEELGRLLSCEVHSSLVLLPAGAERNGDTATTDLVLLPVRGGCDCRVHLEPRTPEPTAAEKVLNLRLRVGEALYVPAGLRYALGGVHAPCVLQVLSLHDSAW